MSKISATARIVVGLVGLSVSLLLAASVIGLFPDERKPIMDGRTRLCESLALNLSAMARHMDVETVKRSFQAIADRNPDLLSVGLRKDDGHLLFEIGEHNKHWTLNPKKRSTDTHMLVPLHADNELWGTVECRFPPIEKKGWFGIILRSEFTFVTFMGVASLIAFYLYLRRVLRQLNPQRVIPKRVREAFDSLAEGLLVLDQKQNIILANKAFENATGKKVDEVTGQSIEEICFVDRDTNSMDPFPWQETLQTSSLITGRLLSIAEDRFHNKTFMVNTAPILDENGKNRGVLASFEDVSQLEQKKEELEELVEHLHASSEKIISQNRELEVLATRDPLTGCLNRRAFFERFEVLWSASHRERSSMSAMMVDVDHFKSINDNFGHSAGDEVLQTIAQSLRETTRQTDLVCRYGGEEFVVILPHTDIEQARHVAEKLRENIQALEFDMTMVTASIGVSSTCQNPGDPHCLLAQADKCLYVAKRNGRNQVVLWCDVPDNVEVDESKISRTKSDLSPNDVSSYQDSTTIPFNSVAALISALAYRDPKTASHSQRVADLCVCVGEGLLSLKDCYILEIAALLHDIGKIGVPDSILLKPGPLTPEEWNIMNRHDRIGVEIIHASFGSPEISAIVENYSARFDGNSNNPRQLKGRGIPIGARILAIADAYDAIVTDRDFRKGRSRQEAFDELRRCAGTQFDPDLVERFITNITIHDSEINETLSYVSAETAISIGNQIQRLIHVLDGQDIDEIRALSQRLHETATKYGVEEIADKACELQTMVKVDEDYLAILQTANELLDLCRLTQRSLLRVHEQKTGEMTSGAAALPNQQIAGLEFTNS